MPTLNWVIPENSINGGEWIAKVPGGWLFKLDTWVITHEWDHNMNHMQEFTEPGLQSVTFIPDPDHTWDMIDLLLKEKQNGM